MPNLFSTGRRTGLFAVLVLLFTLLAGCSGPATPQASASQDELASLKQQMAAQQTSIAALQAQAALSQLVASQATQIAVLQTQVSLAQANAPAATAGAPTAANPPQPTATIIPAVAGLVTDGNTKGSASAKVTITEYVDYF